MNARTWMLLAALLALPACSAPMLSPIVLRDAVDHARAQAVTHPSDLQQVIHDSFAPREPGFRILGPTLDRAGASGIIMHGGRVVTHWGDIDRVDMTFSVTKSYLSVLAGIALRDGLIGSLDERVADHFPDLITGEHNIEITWRHLLQQTSDWSGTLWGVPDWADRPEDEDPENRPLYPPGTRFKYNDVRINLLAYALMRAFGEPLPVVLKREIMDPIGASDDWQWYGYETSWVELDGERMQSVSGGGHFGGGLFISTRDHARFGELMRNRGVWRGRRLLPDAWFDEMREPVPVQPNYGLLWWLNTGRRAVPDAPEDAYWASGFGGNYIYIDECNELVIVLRWIPDLRGVVERVLDAMQYHTGCG